MKVLATYPVSEHVARLLVEAERARLAREVPSAPSLLSRAWDALRAAAERRPRGTAPVPA